MAKVVTFITTVRNNWKKSVFGCVVIGFGVRYVQHRHDTNVLMAEYCREALEYGNLSASSGSKIRNVTIFLNPAADRRRGKKLFDKYCAPLLYLSGMFLTVVETKSQGEARTLAEQLDESVDAVIVAGGDGSLCETVTGLLRRETGENPLSKRIPVGFLPIGATNTVAKYLFGNESSFVKKMAEATMAVIREVKKPVDIIRIEQLEKEREDQRPVYSVSGLKWGAVHDAYAKRDKYWYWGALRTYAAYVFMGYKGDRQGVTWNCSANLSYSEPCSGCSDCYISSEPAKWMKPTRWWQGFVPKQRLNLGPDVKKADYSQIKNDACSKVHSLQVSSVDLTVETSMEKENEMPVVPHIKVSIGPKSISYWDFVARGWLYVKGKSIENVNTLLVKDMTFLPMILTHQDKQHWFYIDNDDYEVKPIHIKLLPERIMMFYQQISENANCS